MVNQYALLVAVAILFAAGITVYITTNGSTQTITLRIPDQVQFKVLDDENEICHYNWDTINGNFRFDCQDNEGYLEVTLFTKLSSTGATGPRKVFHFEQADARYTKDLGTPNTPEDGNTLVEPFTDKNDNVITNAYDHGIGLVMSQPQKCKEEVQADGADTVPTLSSNNWAYDGVCSLQDGTQIRSWRITYGIEQQWFHANLAGNTLVRIGATSRCGRDGNEVLEQKTKSWSANEDIFRTPGNCNAETSPDFVDTTKIDDTAHLFADGSTHEVDIKTIQKPYPLDRYIIENPESTSFLNRRLLNQKEFGTSSLLSDLATYLTLKIPGTNWCGKGCSCEMSYANDHKGCHGCFNTPTAFCVGDGQRGTPCPVDFEEKAGCCVTDEYGFWRNHRANARSGVDISCRQHDKCQYRWESKSSCKCDKVAYYGNNDQGVTGTHGFNYNGGLPRLIFHPRNPLWKCYNWQKKCIKRGWTGFCKKRGWGWKGRRGIPFFFNKYNRGKSLRNGPNNIPIVRVNKDHGWCGGSPPTVSPTPAPPTNPPTTSGGGGGGGGCFLHKKNADGDVMTVLVHKDTLEPMSNTESLVMALIDACDGGDTSILDNHL